MFVKLVLLITCAFFKNFFNRLEISMKFCVFDTHIEYLNENFFLLLFKMFISSKQCMTFYIIFLGATLYTHYVMFTDSTKRLLFILF